MNVQTNISLLPYNTFHIDCIARYFAEIDTIQDFLDLLTTPEWTTNNKKFFLGGGSNILFTEPTFDGLVIRNNIRWKEIREAEDGVYVKVWAGENRNEFVEWTIKKWLCWIENLISIPGSVGAAPIQNIGAYGIEVKDIIVNVWWIDNHGMRMDLTNEQCAFGYRDSIFKHEFKDIFFVTDVTFRLQRYTSESYRPLVEYGAIKQELEKKWISAPTPQEMADVVAAIRASKLPDPKDVWTAGSFFKNVYLTEKQYPWFLEKLAQYKPGLEPQVFPIQNSEFKIINYKVPAGWIIDQLLWYRGYREGDVGCWREQALCLVNYAHATWPEVVQFAEKIQKDCYAKLWIEIEPEVNFIS